jgi:hypothetical protein
MGAFESPSGSLRSTSRGRRSVLHRMPRTSIRVTPLQATPPVFILLEGHHALQLTLTVACVVGIEKEAFQLVRTPIWKNSRENVNGAIPKNHWRYLGHHWCG